LPAQAEKERRRWRGPQAVVKGEKKGRLWYSAEALGRS
jgi:hypothetical protein